MVRKQAGFKGVDDFGIIHHDEMFTYFTYDNTIEAVNARTSEGKSSKFKPRAKKYSHIICTWFNYEERCRLPCSFLHACLLCESRAHVKKKF